MSGDDRWACDTSVAVAAVDPNHEAHERCRRVVVELRPVLAGYAAVETYAVLTRLPPPLRADPATVRTLLDAAFGAPCWPLPRTMAGFIASMASSGIVGGAAYDALVALAATSNGRTLLTRDRRAERTYRSLATSYEFI